MKHSEYVEIIKKSAADIAVKVIFENLILEVPFLAWGPLGPLVKIIVTKVITKSIELGELAIFFRYIDMRVDKQGTIFSEAAIHNHYVQQNGTEDEKKKSEADLIAAFKSFAKFSN